MFKGEDYLTRPVQTPAGGGRRESQRRGNYHGTELFVRADEAISQITAEDIPDAARSEY